MANKDFALLIKDAVLRIYYNFGERLEKMVYMIVALYDYHHLNEMSRVETS